jgi:predicted NUDIX family NTP pyrophosphohydrolase
VLAAGGVVWRRDNSGNVEVLLVHPGGPIYRKKDDGVWTVPKGEATEGEDLLSRATIEFEEELGIPPTTVAAGQLPWIDLGNVKQKGGKTVQAWGFEGELPTDFEMRSNTFEMEWPPRSGRMEQFPEIDRAEFFPIAIARTKMNEAQVAFLDRLIAAVTKP